MSAQLVINADDFGYFDGISAGILEAIRAGVVTATGVVANTEAFERSAAQLAALPQADAGVHLNATWGEPLTLQLRAALATNRGALPRKGHLFTALLLNRLPCHAIATEWKAQIDRCNAAGLTVRFLNSHEHVHMHPRLYPVIAALAREYRIPFVRHTTADAASFSNPSAALRGLLTNAVARLNRPAGNTPTMLGLGPSGQLDMKYLRRALPRLKSGVSYELMCHPGRDDAAAAANLRLRAYHKWTSELECLLDPEFRRMLDAYNVRIVRFRDLVAG